MSLFPTFVSTAAQGWDQEGEGIARKECWLEVPCGASGFLQLHPPDRGRLLRLRVLGRGWFKPYVQGASGTLSALYFSVLRKPVADGPRSEARFEVVLSERPSNFDQSVEVPAEWGVVDTARYTYLLEAHFNRVSSSLDVRDDAVWIESIQMTYELPPQ